MLATIIFPSSESACANETLHLPLTWWVNNFCLEPAQHLDHFPVTGNTGGQLLEIRVVKHAEKQLSLWISIFGMANRISKYLYFGDLFISISTYSWFSVANVRNPINLGKIFSQQNNPKMCIIIIWIQLSKPSFVSAHMANTQYNKI